jgi:hypothetical protein
MSVRTIRLHFKSAAAAGLLGVTALLASAIPASAAAEASLIGVRGTENFTCTHTTHGVNVDPLTRVDNGCGTRIWLHQNLNGSGWGYCISKHSNPAIPTRYENPQQAQVTSNTANC